MKCSRIFHINMKLPDITVTFIVPVPCQSSETPSSPSPPHPSLRLCGYWEVALAQRGNYALFRFPFTKYVSGQRLYFISCHEILILFLLQYIFPHNQINSLSLSRLGISDQLWLGNFYPTVKTCTSLFWTPGASSSVIPDSYVRNHTKTSVLS